jgi:hypothetical protein
MREERERTNSKHFIFLPFPVNNLRESGAKADESMA